MDLRHVVEVMGAAITEDGPDLPRRLCTAFSRAIDGHGSALALMADPTHHHSLTASDSDAAALCQLEFDLGAGPGLEAYAQQRPVLVADVAGADGRRWPVWSATVQARNLPARAVFAFPLRLTGPVFGIVELYREQPGALDESGLRAADIATDLTSLALVRSFEAPQEPDVQGWRLEPEEDSVEVDQAIGMVMAQLRAPAGTALSVLRARAFAQDRAVGEIARDVIARKIAFGPGGEGHA